MNKKQKQYKELRIAFNKQYPNTRFISPFAKQHGTRTGYVYYSCRCYDCANAESEYFRVRKPLLRECL